MEIQDKARVLSLFDEWARNFAPKDFIQSEANAVLLYNYTVEKFGDISISYLITAEKEPGARLQRTPPPKVLTAKEKMELAAKKEQERQRRDYLDSIRQQESWEDKVAAEQAKQAKAAADKAQHDAKAMLDVVISSYSFNKGPNHLDYSGSELVKAVLRRVVSRDANGKVDYQSTLQTVRDIILHEPKSEADVVRILEKLRRP